MEDKNTREQLYGLSGQLLELFVADLFAKNKIDVNDAKQRMTDEQRENLKKTVEQLKAQVEGFLETKSVRKVTAAKNNSEESTVNPLREAVIQRKQKKENKKEQ